jgi:hypothetical protein
MSIKAIQTRYRGYRFRSRLEARWAVFFDNLGVLFDYEVQGFSLPSGPYLPDFWLPKLDAWFEVKPCLPTPLECDLARELTDQTGKVLYLFYGPVPGFGFTDYETLDYGESGWIYTPADTPGVGGGWDNCQAFCVCSDCGAVGIRFEGRSDRLPCKECYQCAYYREPGNQHFDGYCIYTGGGHCSGKCRRQSGGNLDRGHTNDHPRILAAVYAARSARFEHGEAL